MSGSVLLLLRFVKLFAVLALAAGTAGAFLPSVLEERKRAAYLVAAPAFVLTWMSGLVLALRTGTSPVAPWIAGAALASTIGMNVVLWSVARDGRRGWAAGLTSVLALAVSLALMVVRPVLP